MIGGQMWVYLSHGIAFLTDSGMVAAIMIFRPVTILPEMIP